MFRAIKNILIALYIFLFREEVVMKEKARVVYSTERPNEFPILENKDTISRFIDTEIGGMAFIAKRSKNVKQPYTKHLKRHGRAIIMKPQDLSLEGFKLFREIYINPGTTNDLAKRIGKNLGATQFHLRILQQEFPKILSVTKIGQQNYYELQKEESTSAEALYTKHRKPFKRSKPTTKLEGKYEMPKVEAKPEVKAMTVSPTIKQLSDLLDKFKSLEHMVIDVNVTFNIKFGG